MCCSMGKGFATATIKIYVMRQIRKVFFILCMLLAVSVSSYANESNGKELENSTEVETTEKDHNWDRIMDAIIQVESKGDNKARHGNSLGILQITPILVRECNDILKRKGSKKRYTLADRLSVRKSKEMFILIMNQYNKLKSAKLACKIWNSGVNSKNGRESYWKKFLEYYKK